MGAFRDSPAQKHAAKEAAMHVAAAEAVMNGTVEPDGDVVQLGDEFVQFRRQGINRVLVLLVEFGEGRGPLHNTIPQPDRSRDNVTNWRPNYNRAYYRELVFGKQVLKQ